MKRASVLVLSLVVALCLALPLAGCSSSNYTPQLKEQTVNDSALNTAGTLRVGINASNPPYAAQSNGTIVGIDVDIAAALADELGLKLELVDVGTAIDTAFERENVDIVMGAEEANSAYWMSDEYMNSGIALFSLTEDAQAPTEAGSFKIAAQSSSMSAWEVTDHYGESCLENAGDPTAAFEMLSTGSVNYVAAESTIGQYVIHTSGIEAYPIALLQAATPRAIAVGADNTELQENIRLSNRLTATLKLLQNQKHEKDAVIATEGGTAARGLQVLDEVDALQIEHGKLSQQLQGYAKEKEALQAWGNFDPAGVRKLKDAGYVIGFYSCSEGNYKEEWETEYNAMIINRISSKVFFVTVTKAGQEVDLDVEQAKLPAYSLAHLETLYDTTEQAIEENEKKLVALSETDVPSLKAALKELQGQIEFSKVVLSSEQAAGDKLMLVEGWAPAYSKVEIEAYLNDVHVYYEITDPMPGDNVPIRLNNKGFFAWFEPICKLYMLPKYNELDLTPFFAPFFMVFFGLCLGDSGYGLFLFLGATAYRLMAKKVTPSMKSILSLIQVLAVSTFFCGLLTGTFFGANIYDLDWPIVQRLKHAVLMDNNDMFQLSLILGAIQILFGMVLKAVNQTIQFGFKYAVATIGWIILLVSMAVSALLPNVLPMGGTVHLVILGISGAMIFLYNSPGKNIFMNIGLGLWDSYNMATGLLGDVLSYVRLFALGLSGGILAGVFNSLAVGMSPDNVIAGPIVMVLIFVIGHAINIFMNVLGAMVHPMRLTFVEFFKNSGYEGGGKEYKPFRNLE